jgi:hypothetical protein
MDRWYVKVSKFGVICPDATTWHASKEAALAFIDSIFISHNNQITTYFVGRDGERAEEVRK